MLRFTRIQNYEKGRGQKMSQNKSERRIRLWINNRKNWIRGLSVIILVAVAGLFLFVRPALVCGVALDSTESSETTESSESTETEASTEEKKLSAAKITSITIVSKESMKITWKKNKKAEGYLIYRKNEEGEWKKIGKCAGGQKTSYVDTGLTYKMTCTYRVIPYQVRKEKKIYNAPTGKGTSKKLAFHSKYKNGLKLYYDADDNLIKDVEGIIGSQDSYVLKVNTLQCVVTVYAKDGKKGYTIPVKSFLCSPNKYTARGTFYTKDSYRYRTLYYNSYSQWATRIHDDILFHTSPYLKSMDKKSLDVKEYNKMGTCASHGCVRMQCVGVKWIYDNCKRGTKVIIYKSENPGPFGKPKLEKLPAWHTWDPTDPTSAKLCAEKGCH